MFRITARALEEMIAHCKTEYPNEACGYLAGKDGIATKAIPMENIHRSPTSYQMNTAGQLQVQRMIRTEGLEQMAIYHSHVATQAYPSRRDIDNATIIQDFFDGYYVLVTLKDPTPGIRAFKVRDYGVQEEELQEV